MANCQSLSNISHFYSKEWLCQFSVNPLLNWSAVFSLADGSELAVELWLVHVNLTLKCRDDKLTNLVVSHVSTKFEFTTRCFNPVLILNRGGHN